MKNKNKGHDYTEMGVALECKRSKLSKLMRTNQPTCRRYSTWKATYSLSAKMYKLMAAHNPRLHQTVNVTNTTCNYEPS